MCNVIGIAVCCLHFYVFFIWVYAKCQVAWKGPWGCGPCQDISIFPFYFKTYHCRTLFYVFISLGYLVRGKRGTAAWAVRNYLKALV